MDLPRDKDGQIVPPQVGLDHALLLERAATGLAHEGKNPLHTMALHVHLLAEKLAKLVPGDASLVRHTNSLRDGIAKVDALLRNFGELAAPARLEADLGTALTRAILLFGYQGRRGGGQVAEPKGPKNARVQAQGAQVAELVAHALLASMTLARGGGVVRPELRESDTMAELVLESQGGLGVEDEAALHLAAVRRLAGEIGAGLSVNSSTPGSARLSISLPRAQ